MTRFLLAAAVLAAFAPGSWAAEPAVRLDVQPMTAPKPALKYLLLPEVGELKPGNPVQWYVRCFMEQRLFFFNKEVVAERARYRSMPLAELPAQNLRGYGGSALTQADWGARLDTPDWQVIDRIQSEGTDVQFPEIASLRLLGTALQVRFRGEVARGDFDEAVGTAKTMFALARHLGEHPTTAANRAGLAVAQLALDTLEEMVGQPGCPNLYWALTDLPCPLVELRKGVQGDRVLAAAELRAIRDDAPMTGEQIEELVSRLSGRLGFAREQAGSPPRNFRAALKARTGDPKQVGDVRGRLLAAVKAQGVLDKLSAFRIAAFPAEQVILLDERREYEVRRDDELKLLSLPPWQADALGGATRGGGLFAEFLPRVTDARREQARVEQRVGLLRHVEALRMYAAEHGGKLPGTLSDVAVPLPTDPFTGKAFEYRLDGATAHLRGGAPKGEEKNPAFAARYEITVRKDEGRRMKDE
jgi:hypothetical protein